MSIFNSLKKLRILFSRREKIRFCLLVAGMLVGAILETFSIGIIPLFINAAIEPQKIMRYDFVKELWELLGITTQESFVLWGSVALIIIFAFKNGYLCLQYYLQACFTQNVFVRLTHRLFSVYMHAPYEYHLQQNTARLLRNAQQEIPMIIVRVVQPLLILMLNGFIVVAILILLFFSQPFLTFFTITFLFVAGVGYQLLIKKTAHAYSEDAQVQRNMIIQNIQEGLGALKEIKILQRERVFVKTLRSTLDRIMKANRYISVVSRVTSPYMESVVVTGYLGIVLILVCMGHKVGYVASTLGLFAAAFMRLKGGGTNIIQSVTHLRTGVVSIDPVYNDIKLLEKTKKVTSSKHQEKIKDKLELLNEIRLEKVCYQYPGDKNYALKDINIVIPKSTFVAFVGPSGAGKTTIIDIILGLLEPQKGRVMVDGHDIILNRETWYNCIGYVPQDIYLTDNTLKANIGLGLTDDEIDNEQLWSAIRAANLESFVNSLTHGVDTIVGERGARLSGGQKQRIGIARALYHNPDVLIMDEATSALDRETERSVIEAINKLKDHRTIIMIAHRLATVKACGCLYFIKEGEIESVGTYNELLKRNEQFCQFTR